MPSMAVLYVDDCAVSRTRVGPSGVIAVNQLDCRAVLVDCAE